MKLTLELAFSLFIVALGASVLVLFSATGIQLLAVSATAAFALTLLRRLGIWSLYRALIFHAAKQVDTHERLAKSTRWKAIDAEYRETALKTSITAAAIAFMTGGILLVFPVAVSASWTAFAAIASGLFMARMLRSETDVKQHARLLSWLTANFLSETQPARVERISVESDVPDTIAFAVDYTFTNEIPEEEQDERLAKAMLSMHFQNGGMWFPTYGLEIEKSDKKFCVIAGNEEVLATLPALFEGFQKSLPYPKTINVQYEVLA